MGSSCSYKLEFDLKRQKMNQLKEVYKDIKSFISTIRECKEINISKYLISTKSIPNFIKIIEDSHVFENINKSNENTDNLYKSENRLFESFKFYELEDNIKIYCNYEECNSLTKQSNEGDNEFIIVDEPFIINMNINYFNIENMKVNFIINKDKIMEIEFPISKKVLMIQQKKIGIFKFIKK